MKRGNKLNLSETLGLRWPEDNATSRRVIRVVGYIFFLAGLLLVALVLFRLTEALLGLGTYSGGETQSAAIRNIGLFLAAIIGVPFLVWRSVVAQKQVEVAEQGHITDRINKAVEGLGATKLTKTVYETPRYQRKDGEWFRDNDGNPVPALRPDSQETIDREVVETSQPNLEVRIGAIYALERISQDSERDHVQIMEILCAYVRESAQAANVSLPKGAATQGDWWDWIKHDVGQLRLDVDVALRVIERRSDERKNLEIQTEYRLGLDYVVMRKVSLRGRNLEGAGLYFAELQGADLSFMNLQGADLMNASLQGANLEGADLQKATLAGAQLTGAYIRSAKLRGTFLAKAKLRGAKLEGSDLRASGLFEAELQQADLASANLQKVSLFGVDLAGANLSKAKLQNARLDRTTLDEHTNLKGALLNGAAVCYADFTKIPQILEHLSNCFGDGSIILPGGHGPDHADWPPHWPKFDLGSDFYGEWRKWQDDPVGYVPPDPPDDME